VSAEVLFDAKHFHSFAKTAMNTIAVIHKMGHRLPPQRAIHLDMDVDVDVVVEVADKVDAVAVMGITEQVRHLNKV
jgi:hypothetical protein